MTTLTPGANAPLPSGELTVLIRHGAIPGAEIDVSAFLVTGSGKVRSDADMCFYGQPSVADGAVTLEGSANGETRFSVAPGRIPAGVDKVVLTATIHENRAAFGRLPEVLVEVGGVRGQIPCAGMTETALILAELYQRNGAWKVRIVGQGFNGGLAALATHLGVDIAEPAPTPKHAPSPKPPVTASRAPDLTRVPSVRPAPRPPAPTINLSKVNLTKENRTISLKKGTGRFGKIRVNLNWNQRPNGGVMKMFGPKPVDLDLGCLIEDRHGNRTCVQALGGGFGDYGYFPYAKLLGDDRTGAVSDGEWLEINGEMWAEFNRILIFAFIYEGVPNWAETDGVVRVMIPDQPEVEVRMNEHGSRDRMCAIAMLENQGGAIRVSREVRFFTGHRYMDEHYGWGMNWKAGSK
jgi:tellurite resistance protein TerA